MENQGYTKDIGEETDGGKNRNNNSSNISSNVNTTKVISGENGARPKRAFKSLKSELVNTE